jgi:hypothetical protein
MADSFKRSQTAITATLVTSSGVNDIFIAEDRYAVVATLSGIDVIDLYRGYTISSGTLGGEPLCVAAEWTTATGNMYIGTSSSGIYSTPWKAVRAPGLNFTANLVQEFTTATDPALTSNQVNDISVLPRRIFVSTAAGVDFITDSSWRAFRPLLSGSNACGLTAAGEAYWNVINSGVETNYDLFPASGTGIITVDFEYNGTNSDPLLPSPIINDLAVSPGSPNLLGFATPETDLIIQESQGSEQNSLIKTVYSGQTPVVSIDFSENSDFDGGLVYLGVSNEVPTIDTNDALRVFGLADVTVSGTHFHTISSDTPEVVNTRGQPLITGTVGLVRVTSVA